MFKKLQHHEFPLQGSDWEDMQKRLDEGTPSERKPIISFFTLKNFIAMSILSLLIAAIYSLWQPVQHIEKQAVVPKITQDTLPAKSHEKQNKTFSPTKKRKLKSKKTLPFSAEKQTLLPAKTLDKLPDFQGKLNAFNQQMQFEKVYLQVDRTLYKPDEDVWFSMYLRDANTLLPSQQSQVLYVDLLSPNGNVQETKTYLVLDGQAAGDFHLPASLKGGIYKIRAYTNWMKNTNDAFEREITLQAVVLPNLNMKLEFERKAYSSNDEVVAKFDANTLENKPLRNKNIDFKVSFAGNILLSGKAKTDENGRALVKFTLPDSLQSNDALLNITTPYNGQTEAISRAVPIVLNKIDLQFLPEGGEFVNTFNNNIGFKAIDEFGKPADVEGVVKNAKGETITRFKSFHDGMGAFDFSPLQNEKYSVFITKPEGIKTEYALPESSQKGAILRVTQKKDYLDVSVATKDSDFETAYLVVQMNGKVLHEQIVKNNTDAVKTLEINTSDFPMGVASVTLFDKNNQARNERLVFLNRHKALNINIVANKEKYAPREKVSLNVKVTDDKGKPVKGNFSLAVGDDTQLTFADDKEGHILSALLLENDLKGKIEEPNFYFDEKEEKSLAALDYLMLTQGWRKMDWKKVMEEKALLVENYQFQNEKTLFTGRILDKKTKKPVSGYSFISYPNYLHFTTDEQGYIAFFSTEINNQIYLFSGDQKIYLDEEKDFTFYSDGYNLFDEKGHIASFISEPANNYTSTGQIVGKVQDIDENPISNCEIKIYQKGKLKRHTFSDRNGIYVFNLPSGDYDLIFKHQTIGNVKHEKKYLLSAQTLSFVTIFPNHLGRFNMTTENTNNLNECQLSGKITDVYTNVLGATITLYKNGEQLNTLYSYTDGNYFIQIKENGLYDIEFSYNGLKTQRFSKVKLLLGQKQTINAVLNEEDATELEEVVVKYNYAALKKSSSISQSMTFIERQKVSVGNLFKSKKSAGNKDVAVGNTIKPSSNIKLNYDTQSFSDDEILKDAGVGNVSLPSKPVVIKKDNTTSGSLIASDQITNLPTRNVSEMVANTVGVSSNEGDGNIRIKGSRDENTIYMVDGVRVNRESLPPAQEIDQPNPNLGGVEAKFEGFEDQNKNVYTGEVKRNIRNSNEMPFKFEDGLNRINPTMSGEIGKEIRIRGTASMNKDSDPLYIIDGIVYQYRSSLDYLDPNDISKIEVRKDIETTALYGVAARNGVVLITTKNGWKGENPMKYSFSRTFYAPKYQTKTANDIRNDFRSTIYFNPKIETNEQGEASIEFFNSDAVTTFRATLEGIGATGSLGRKEFRYAAQMPMSVSAKAPDKVLTGDVVNIPLYLRNNNSEALQGKLSVVVPTNFEAVGDIPQAISLAANEAKTVFLSYKVKSQRANILGEKQIFSIKFEANGVKDEFTTSIKTLSRGFPVTQIFSADKLKNDFNLALSSPVESTATLVLTAYPSALEEVLQGMENMLQQPSGCFEQVSSTNYPNLLVLDLLHNTQNIKPDVEKKAMAFLQDGYKRLTAYECKSGGYDWWGRDPAHEGLTAYGILEFTDMARVFDVDKKMIDRTVKWLLGRRNGKGGWTINPSASHGWENDDILNAYICYALAEADYGNEIKSEIEQIYTQIESKNDAYTQALLANTFLAVGDKKRAKLLIDKLLRSQKEDGSFTGNTHSVFHAYGQGFTIETTALAALAFLKSGENETALLNAISFIGKSKSEYGYGNTQSTVMALKALCGFAAKNKTEASGGKIIVLADGKKVAEQTYSKTQFGKIQIAGLEQFIQNEKTNIKVVFEGTEKAIPYDLKLQYSSKLPQNATGSPLKFNTVLAQKEAKIGDVVRLSANLENVTNQAVASPLMLIGIPAGLTPQPWQLRQLVERKECAFYEIFNNYIVFYFDELPAKTLKTIHLDLRSDIGGSYDSPASAAYPYYTNEWRVWSKGENISIQ